jgi:hypothetical protein
MALVGYLTEKVSCLNQNSDNVIRVESQILHKYMEQMRDSLNTLIPGTYEGSFYSSTNIPSAGVYPGYSSYSVEIGRLISENTNRSFISENITQKGIPHLKGAVAVMGTDASGYSAQFSGYILIYPSEMRACFLANDNSSLLGGDPCGFNVTTNKFIAEHGFLQKELR